VDLTYDNSAEWKGWNRRWKELVGVGGRADPRPCERSEHGRRQAFRGASAER